MWNATNAYTKNNLATFHQLHGLSKNFSQLLLLHEIKNGNLFFGITSAKLACLQLLFIATFINMFHFHPNQQ